MYTLLSISVYHIKQTQANIEQLSHSLPFFFSTKVVRKIDAFICDHRMFSVIEPDGQEQRISMILLKSFFFF